LDGWGGPLLLLTGVIIFAGVLASWTIQKREKEYFVLLLVLVAGVYGVFVSQDLLVFFLFYEIAVLPMYLLIGIWGASHEVPAKGPFRVAWSRFAVGDKQYAAMKLTLMLLVGSAAILAAIFAMYAKSGSISFDLEHLAATHFDRDDQIVLFPLIWLGFGTLAGVFPFHTWSPDGHASAPTAVSMLHAGVLMKLGAFGVMRVGMVVLPEGAQFWIPAVGAVAAINVLYGAFCAMSQSDLKYIVAYSSVSHMGVVMLGAATLTPAGWDGAVFQMVAHGIMTGLFFALVGLVYERAHTRSVPTMGGFATVMPGVAAFFTLACLSSLGLPGTAGFVSEFLVFLGAWKSGHYFWAIPGVLGAFVTAIYVLRATRAIFWGPGPSEKFHELSDARRTEWGAPILLGVCLILFGVWPRLLLDTIDSSSITYLARLVAAPIASVP
jgi:NADH-quinone oxidoreductase subunit M